MSDYHLIRLLQYLALLLFVSGGALALSGSRYWWAKWVRRSSIAIFAVVFLYALVLTAFWALRGAD
ncbi:MAG: hypothetical protein J2P48_04325 [Alphaproteobacteria bacterium]|nr:hypothetical protein [Alphaproteobacteria bacterium]